MIVVPSHLYSVAQKLLDSKKERYDSWNKYYGIKYKGSNFNEIGNISFAIRDDADVTDILSVLKGQKCISTNNRYDVFNSLSHIQFIYNAGLKTLISWTATSIGLMGVTLICNHIIDITPVKNDIIDILNHHKRRFNYTI